MNIGGIEVDLKFALLIVGSTTLAMLDWYDYRIFSLKAYDRFVYYLVIPMLVVLVLFREHPREYGFQLGNWREGLIWVVAVSIVMSLILYLVVTYSSDMQSYYGRRMASASPSRIAWINTFDLIGWEFLWRGVFLFGLARVIGPGPAIFVSAIPFAFAHLGKPPLETFSTIFGGVGFAFIAWRTDSFVYPFLIHWYIANFTMILSVVRFG
jgi:membrane protease YdiL (CAAX protease family)